MEKKSVYIKIGIGVVVLLVGIVVFALGCAEIDRFSSSERTQVYVVTSYYSDAIAWFYPGNIYEGVALFMIGAERSSPPRMTAMRGGSPRAICRADMRDSKAICSLPTPRPRNTPRRRLRPRSTMPHPLTRRRPRPMHPTAHPRKVKPPLAPRHPTAHPRRHKCLRARRSLTALPRRDRCLRARRSPTALPRRDRHPLAPRLPTAHPCRDRRPFVPRHHRRPQLLRQRLPLPPRSERIPRSGAAKGEGSVPSANGFTTT